MLLIQLETQKDINIEVLKTALAATLAQMKGVESVSVLDGEQYVIRKKIPVYSPEELTAKIRGEKTLLEVQNEQK